MSEAVTVNLRHLELKPMPLEGEISAKELGIETGDELVHPAGPLYYDLIAEKIDKAVLVQGQLEVALKCECARCLKPIDYALKMDDWACHLALEGEDAVPIKNDVVDLTPQIREDILLAFPQRPLCEPECKGLPNPWKEEAKESSNESNSAWTELNKLKL